MTVLARAKVVLEGDTISLTRSLQGATKSMQQAGRRMGQIGKTLSTKVTLPLLAVGLGAIKAFADFDSAMTQSLAIMGDVSDMLKNEMSEAAKDVARQTTFSAHQAAEAYFFLASAGLDAEQSIAALPQVARFAQAGMFDMAFATDLATDAQSALGLTVDDAQQNLVNLTRVTDVLVKANTLANASVSQFSEALTREAGAALKTFNKDIEEGVAVLAAFADQGVKSQIAGTGLSRILRLMTAAATKNKKELADLEIEVFDAGGTIRNFADIIEDMEISFGKMSDETRTAALESIGFTARVQGILLPLLGTSKAIRRYEAELRNAGNTTREVADKQMTALAAQLKLTWNQIVLAAEAAGEVMEPAVRALGTAVKAAAAEFEHLNTTARTAVVVVFGLTAGLGPLLLGLGLLVRVLAFASAGVALMIPKVIALQAALMVMGGALATGGLILVGLGALGFAFSKMKQQAKEAAEAMEEATRKMRASLLDVTPEQAAKRIVAFKARVESLREGMERYRAQARLAELAQTGFADATTTSNRVLGDSPAVLRAAADGIQETIDRFDVLILQYQAIAAAAAVAGEDPNKNRDAKPPAWMVAADEATKILAASLQETVTLNTLLKDSFDLPAAQAAAYAIAVRSMVEAGVPLNTQIPELNMTLQELANRYLSVEQSVTRAATAQEILATKHAEAALITQSVQTPLEIYNATIDRLKELLFTAGLGQEAYNRALSEAKAAFTDATEGAEDMESSLKGLTNSMLNSFVNFTTTAGSSWAEMVDGMIKDMVRLIAKMAIVKALQTVVFPGFGGFFAHGGFLQEGKLGVVGEEGPELIQAGRGGVTIQPVRQQMPAPVGLAPSDPGSALTVTLNTENLPPRPRVMSPDALALDDWWRTAFGHLVIDYTDRGGAFS